MFIFTQKVVLKLVIALFPYYRMTLLQFYDICSFISSDKSLVVGLMVSFVQRVIFSCTFASSVSRLILNDNFLVYSLDFIDVSQLPMYL